jgi:hypothetical protein
VPFEHPLPWFAESVYLRKRHWFSSEDREMTFRESLASGVGWYTAGEEFVNVGVQVINNTADDIDDVTMEMHHRFDGTWQPDPEDEALQARFWETFPRSELNQVLNARIRAVFLGQLRASLELSLFGNGGTWIIDPDRWDAFSRQKVND